jgi:hypothetical protein
MVTQFDDKGKIFTQVISKKPVAVVIQTTQQTIHGTIYVRPEERVIDELNHSQPFLAVTEASILAGDGSIAYQSNFLTLNAAQIVWVIPVNEITSKKVQADE